MSATVLTAAPARSRESLLYPLLAAMVFFWSLNYIAGKVALRSFPPLLLGGLRTALAGVLIAPIFWWQARRDPGLLPRARRDAVRLLTLGFFGVAVNQLFFILGLSRTSVAHAAILIGLTPIMVLLIAAAVRLERITASKLGGMLIAIAGVGVLNTESSKGPHATALGNAFVLLGALAFAVFTVAGKRVTGSHGSVTVSTFAYVGGALMLAPVTLWQSAGFDYGGASAAGWGSLLFMAAFPSVVCYLIYYWALSHIAASRVAAFSYFQPPLATLLALPLLGEPLSWPLVAGGALVFGGVYLTERAR